MKTYSSLFSGFGGADKGLEAAGLEPINLFEYDPKLAEVGQANTKGKYIVEDVRNTVWSRYEAPDVLWVSPPCTRASTGSHSGLESVLDMELAAASMRAVETFLPAVVLIENVSRYRHFKAFALISSELERLGYSFRHWHLNSADFGVPQTRRRLIVIARRGRHRIKRPESTHAQNPVENLFGCLKRWNGWYGAIKDIADDLPESQFAQWQMERLPEKWTESFLSERLNYSNPNPNRAYDEPSMTVTCYSPKHPPPRAFIVEGSAAGMDNKFTMPVRGGDEPVFTMRATQNNPRASVEPGRVVKMIPRCIARFQSFPDSFELSGTGIDSIGLGNAVPSLLAQQVYESIL